MHKNVSAFKIALLVLVAGVTAAFTALWLAIDWTDDGADVYSGGIVLRNAAGDVMRVSLGAGDVDNRPYYEADPDDWIVKALVAAEDGTFWKHCGVRPLSALRAAFQNVLWRRRVSGASTITMQTVRLIRPHPKTLWWKCKEAVMAVKMERAKDKLWILSQYLNRAPYGSNLIGIEAAANGWFGKGAKDLGLGEAAMLAGMVQAPSRLRPDRRMEHALKRRDYVLDRMVKLGLATSEQVAGARLVRPVVRRAQRPFSHPYYCDWALRQVGMDRDAQRRGGDMITVLDENVQVLCEGAVNNAASDGGYSVAIVVMRVDTGAIVALACSGNYFDGGSGQVNTALAPRPAGSTLKPFLAAKAMDCGIATPETMIADAPIVVKGYRPKNFDSKYRGLVSLRDSLVLSLNIPFVRLLRRVGVLEFENCLCDLGLSHLDVSDGSLGLGLAIGNAEVSLVELVAAYGTIARGGFYLPPSAFVGSSNSGDRVFSAGVCYHVSEMLSGDERSAAALGHIADVPLPRFAWKTGTSSAYRDAWTVAWNPEWVIGVWCGHKSGGFGDKTLVGVKAAAPVAWRIARSLYPRSNGPWYVKPPDVARPVPFLESPKDTLVISTPEDGAVFCLTEEKDLQTIVCKAVGIPPDARLWWFADGALVGESSGSGPLSLNLSRGEHDVACSTDDGATSTVHIRIQ